MSALAPRYDVALSFLYPDLNLAKALYDELSKGLPVRNDQARKRYSGLLGSLKAHSLHR